MSLLDVREVECPSCGHTFKTDVWVTVNYARLPLLNRRLRKRFLNGTLNVRTCPKCKKQFDVPGFPGLEEKDND